MTDIFYDFTTDTELEVNGVWKTIRGGAKLLVARFGNDKFVRECDKLREQNREALANDDDAAKDLWAKLRRGAMAKYILVGWEDITFKGEPVPYSVDKAAEFLERKDFSAVVEAIAIDMDNYKVKQEAEQTKN